MRLVGVEVLIYLFIISSIFGCGLRSADSPGRSEQESAEHTLEPREELEQAIPETAPEPSQEVHPSWTTP